MSKWLILMVGVPGSGKSTFCKHFYQQAENCEIISRDAIRFELLKEGGDYFSRENEVWETFVNKAISSLQHNEKTVLDATHINEASRKKIINAIKAKYWDNEIKLCAIFMDEEFLTCIDRNNEREGLARIPEKAIVRMWNQLTIPSKAEGFEQVLYIGWDKQFNDYVVLEERDDYR